MRDPSRPRALREFLGGLGLIGHGLRTWVTAPRLMWLGMVPALIVGAAAIAALVVLGFGIAPLSAWVTPFAEGWDEPWRTGIRVLSGAVIAVLAVLLLVFSFTALTLAVGSVFYEKIWHHVESRFGPPPTAPARGFWRGLRKGLGDGIRMLLSAIGFAALAAPFGFIPVVGPALAAVLSALFGGWLLATELTGFGFDARGFTLSQRRRALRGRRACALGFGLGVYLLFLIPLGAVIIMPAAVAGATLLSRRVLGEPVEPA